MPCKVNDQPSFTPITRIINVLIHHVSMRVIRTDVDLLRLPDWELTLRHMLAPLFDVPRTLKPYCIVESDRKSKLEFSIGPLIETFQEYIIRAVFTLCGESGLNLLFRFG